jgi:hypothetical protein
MAAVNMSARIAVSVAAVSVAAVLAAGLLAGCSSRRSPSGHGIYDQFNPELDDRRSAALDACTSAPNGPCSDAMNHLMITVGNIKSAVDAEHDPKKYAETLQALEAVDRDYHTFQDKGCEGFIDRGVTCPSYANVVVTDVAALESALLRA